MVLETSVYWSFNHPTRLPARGIVIAFSRRESFILNNVPIFISSYLLWLCYIFCTVRVCSARVALVCHPVKDGLYKSTVLKICAWTNCLSPKNRKKILQSEVPFKNFFFFFLVFRKLNCRHRQYYQIFRTVTSYIFPKVCMCPYCGD